MTDKKFDKYIITKYRDISPEMQKIIDKSPVISTPMLWLDDTIAQGAFYTECHWLWSMDNTKPWLADKAHTHEFDEVLGFLGSRRENPHDLNAEIEKNRTIASERWNGQFLPFHTHAWEARQDGVPMLPANLREDITQAYVDIRLANSVVWLSTQLGCRSQNLDEKYTQLCANIATRFDRIMPLLKHSGS